MRVLLISLIAAASIVGQAARGQEFNEIYTPKFAALQQHTQEAMQDFYVCAVQRAKRYASAPDPSEQIAEGAIGFCMPAIDVLREEAADNGMPAASFAEFKRKLTDTARPFLISKVLDFRTSR